MKPIKLVVSLWLPVLIWCLAIFYLSSIPSLRAAKDPNLDEVIRNFLHFLFYGVGYILFFRALNYAKKKKNYWLPLLLVSLYGLTDEYHQSLVPTRTFQFKDLGFDFIGALAGKLSTKLFLPKIPSDWVEKWQLA